MSDHAKKVFRVCLSVLAALVTGFGTTTTLGSWQVPPSIAEAAVALGSALAFFGYVPIRLPPALSRLFAALSMAMAVVVGSHASSAASGTTHGVFVALGALGTLLGLLARNSQPAVAAKP